MSTLMETLKKDFVGKKCVGKKLLKKGCRVSLEGVSQPHLIINLDKLEPSPGPNKKRCDYLFFAENANGHDWVFPIEMKKGCLDEANDLIKQINAGVRAAEKILNSYHLPVQCVPVAVFGRISKDTRKKLRETAVAVSSLKCSKFVKCMSCGAPLMDVLRK